ncbi:MAG: hypothetical protein ABH859_08345 [Pseudomonadota bacterium]
MSIQALNQAISTARSDGVFDASDVQTITGQSVIGQHLNAKECRRLQELVGELRNNPQGILVQDNAVVQLEAYLQRTPNYNDQVDITSFEILGGCLVAGVVASIALKNPFPLVGGFFVGLIAAGIYHPYAGSQD